MAAYHPPVGVANRLHRSGAIDFNIEFDVHQAHRQAHPTGAGGCDLRAYVPATAKDSYSVCEGEPLFTCNPRKRKANCMLSQRTPRPCLSSLNGLSVTGWQSKDEMVKTPQAAEALRDAFFKEYIPSGVAVTKWAYEQLGHQANNLVATHGGLNTVYCDEDVEVGDTLVVDMPFSEKIMDEDAKYDGVTAAHDWGFLVHRSKRGVPSEKTTLVVRAIPIEPDLKKSFARRGQILGVCVTAAKRGLRCDVVHGASAMGLVNTVDMHS